MSELYFNDFNNMNQLWHAYCQHAQERHQIKCTSYGKAVSLKRHNLIDGNIWLEVGLCVNKLLLSGTWKPNFVFFMFNKGQKGTPNGNLYKQGLNQLADILTHKGLISGSMNYE